MKPKEDNLIHVECYPETILQNIEWLLTSEPIVSLVGNEFKHSKNLVDDINEFYQREYRGSSFTICEVVVNKNGDKSGFYLHNVDIKQKLLSGTWPVRSYNGESQTRKSTSKASKLIVADIISDVNEYVKMESGSDQSSLETIKAVQK